MPRWPLALVLACSLAANALLLARRRGGPAPAPARDDRGPPAPRLSWPSLSPPPPAPARPVAGEPARALPRPAVAGKIDAALEQEALCTIAQEKLREGWRRDRETLARDLRRSLADSDEQERNVVENGGKLAAMVEVPEPRRAALVEQYRGRRLRRVGEAAAALAREPADYAALADAVRGLFADEDELALAFGGEAGRERLRAAELEGRTTLLAIAAAMADAPFDALSW